MQALLPVALVLLVGPALLVTGMWTRYQSRKQYLVDHPPLASAKLDDGKPFKAPRGQATAGTRRIIAGTILSVFSVCIATGAYYLLNGVH